MRGKVFFFTGASFCAIFFLEPSGNLLLEPSGSSWVPPDGSIFVFAIGSPPRMRGKVAAAVPALFLRGITPACAGKSEKQVPFLPPYQDHPRVCGEKDLYGDATVREWESPPRMRGKVHSTVYADGSSRITPAYAGKRSRCTFVQRLRWDHPRVCGEKMVSMIPHRRSRGSPPRVRGKGIKRGCHSHQCGITPACAGKRRLRRRFSTLPQDHPRVCGEKNCGSKLAFRTMGSPPRMRGKE